MSTLQKLEIEIEKLPAEDFTELARWMTTRSATLPKLTREEAAELRGRLASWEEDWNAPGMEVYDKP